VCGAEGNSKKGWERVAAKQEKETKSRADDLERGPSRAWVERGGRGGSALVEMVVCCRSFLTI
jgi:hypothetical protein